MVSQCPSLVVRRPSCGVNNCFKSLLLLHPWAKTRYLVGSIGVTCRSKIAEIVRSEIQDGHHLENIFFASSPEPQGLLTPNLVGSIRVSCSSKIHVAKIVLIENPRWQPS